MKNNWQTKKVGEICDINPTKSETRNLSDGTTVSFVSMSSVDEHSQSITVEESREYAQVKKGYTYFKRGDILFAKITPCMENGKVALSNNLKNEIGFGSTEFHVLRAKDTVLPEYVYHLVRSEFFRNEAGKRMTGSAGQKRVPREFLENYEIPLPPLSTQKEIVKMLDEKMGKIGEAKRLRAEALADTEKILPQTLHEIFAEGKKNGWKEEELGGSVKLQGGFAFKSPEYKTTGIPLIRIQNLQDEIIDLSKAVYIEENPTKDFKKFLLRDNDILIAMSGATTGKLARVSQKQLPSLLNQRVGRFVVKDATKISAEFLWFFLKSLQDSILLAAYGGAQPNISPSKIESIKIVIPPLAEQQKIVAKLDALSEKVRILRDLQIAQLADLKSLEKAYLREAFSEKLV